MICEIMLYYSISLNVTKIAILLLLNILYLFRDVIYKWVVLFLFKRCKYGNISFIEKSAVLKPDLTLEQVEKDVLNIVNDANDPSVILYITNEKFYENFLFYGELGLKKSYNLDFHTEHLYGLFEIIYTTEWCFHKKFIDAYNVPKKKEAPNTLTYNDDEFLFYIDDETDFSSDKINIVVHNGNFDFKNTSLDILGKTIFSDSDISKKFLYKKVERFSPDIYASDYHTTFLKFLFQKNYLTYNHYIV